MYRFSKAKSEKTRAADGNESLFRLVILTIRIGFFDDGFTIANKIIDSLGNIRQTISTGTLSDLSYTIDSNSANQTDENRNANILDFSASEEVESDGDRRNDENGSKIRLKYE